MFHVKHSPVPLLELSYLQRITCMKEWSREALERESQLDHGDHTNRKTHIIIGIAKTRTRHAGDTSFLKQ